MGHSSEIKSMRLLLSRRFSGFEGSFNEFPVEFQGVSGVGFSRAPERFLGFKKVLGSFHRNFKR